MKGMWELYSDKCIPHTDFVVSNTKVMDLNKWMIFNTLC